MRKLALTFGFLVALSGQAVAQSFPMTLPAQTVYGRLGVSAGPGQAIPFATLQGILVTGGETTVNDTNYAVVATDRTIVYTAITAARTVTLLPASAYLPGTRIHVFDRSGSASATKTVSLSPTGADLINGANATFLAIIGPYTEVEAETDGISKWTALLSATSFANPTASVGLTAVNGSATTAMRSDAAPALSQAISPTMTGNWIFAPTSGNAISIATAANTTARAVTTSQTGPVSGSTTATAGTNCTGGNNFLAYNYFCVESEGANLTGGVAPYYTYANLSGLVTGGASSTGTKIAHQVTLFHSAASAPAVARDNIGLNVSALSQASEGGTNTGAGAIGTMFGLGCVSNISVSATNYFVVSCGELDIGITSPATAKNRWGLSIIGVGNTVGAVSDIGLEFSSAGQPFSTAIGLTNFHGGAPVTTTGCIICTDGSSNTIATFADLSTYTISGNILNFANAQLTGNGALTLGASTHIGTVALKGNTSGTATITPQAAAGTPTLTIGTTSGTIAASATSPLAISATTGVITCATCTTSAASLTANQLVIGSGSQGEQSLGSLGTTVTVLHGNAAGAPTFAAVSLTADVSGVLPVANGGTNCSSASITCFNNITGFTAAGTTGTTSTNLVFSASPTITGTLTATTVTASGAITTSLTTDASSISTGALQTAGGLGVTKTAYFGGVAHYTLTALNTATGAGFWLDSKTTGADRWFFGADASSADIFRIFSVLASANIFSYAAAATPSSGALTLEGSIILTGGISVAGTTITLTNLGTDATHTDRTVCQDTTSKSLFFGSGAAGICLGTSSAAFKHDIARLSAGLDQIVRLEAVSYKLNADHGDPDKILYGFTAEQGATVLPDLVGRDEAGHPQTFDYMGVVPVLVRAVQQLKAELETVKGRVAK